MRNLKQQQLVSCGVVSQISNFIKLDRLYVYFHFKNSVQQELSLIVCMTLDWKLHNTFLVTYVTIVSRYIWHILEYSETNGDIKQLHENKPTVKCLYNTIQYDMILHTSLAPHCIFFVYWLQCDPPYIQGKMVLQIQWTIDLLIFCKMQSTWNTTLTGIIYICRSNSVS